MNNLEFVWNLDNLDLIIDGIKQLFFILYIYYVFTRVTNIKKVKLKEILILGITSVFLTIIIIIAKKYTTIFFSTLIMIGAIAFINISVFKKETIYTIVATTISFAINYAVYAISILFVFLPHAIFMIENDYIILGILMIVYSTLLVKLFKIKRMKYGITFLRNKIEDSYINMFIFYIGITILLLYVIFKAIPFVEVLTTGTVLIIILICMALLIKSFFQLYYKQNLLIKELKETKAELEAKKKEIEKLEKENLEFNKTSHSLSHKQRALEFKLNSIMNSAKQVTIDEISIRQELDSISKELYKEPKNLQLPKTDIPSIDNMFEYMQSECIKNDISFELQVVGNIHHMVNNLISENDLEILIADHIKDAIIAINYASNSFKSILVRIGKIDNVYSLYIYDSGIEFTSEVLEKLGKEPITTHKDSGGTGMGFMNTFDTIKRTNASFTIKEIGEPCDDNYTKALIFKFDNNNTFEIISYKEENKIPATN